MTALPKDFLSNTGAEPRPKGRRQERMPRIHAIPVMPAQETEMGNTAPVTLPVQELPTALQVLSQLQRATTVVTLGLVTVALGVYGWTVYTPMQWSREYTKLKTLQQTERQLLANTESIKNQLARQAEQPQSGLVKVSPQQNIFLPATMIPPPPAVQEKATAGTALPLVMAHKPLAY
jgi:hypothetical protein